jgi:tetratricopeptide (TPR) repeat protein
MRHSVHSIFFEQADGHEAAARWDQALALLYQAQRWAHTDAAYWTRLGLLSLRMAEPTWLNAQGLIGTHTGDMAALNAELYLERAARLAPGDPAPAFWQAWVLHRTGREAATVRQALDEALARNPRWPYALALRGRQELAEREPGYAARACEAAAAAVEALPESPRLHYDLGAAQAAAGDAHAARAAFCRAVALPPLPQQTGTAAGWLDEAFHGQPGQLRAWVEAYYGELFAGRALPAPRP